MANNLQNIADKVDNDIDENGAPGSILAKNHNDILKQVLDNVGQYVGSPYIAKKNETVVPTGIFSWDGNAMNVLTAFEITLSKWTLDLNDVGKLLVTMSPGGIIKFKDFVGRSVFLEYQSHVADVDSNTNPIYIITVKGFAENPNYIYQNNEQQISIVEMFTGIVNGSKLELFTATASQTEFELNSTPANVDVYIDRVRQIETIDFTLLTNTVTLTDPSDVGSKVEIRKF